MLKTAFQIFVTVIILVSCPILIVFDLFLSVDTGTKQFFDGLPGPPAGREATGELRRGWSGGRFTFTFSRPHSLSAAALCFICRFQFYISHGKIQNLGKILSPWIEITIGPKEGVSTCPSLKQRNVDASFKQMVLLGRKRCCLLAVICRPVDMPENFHLATYQLFYRRHWTQESIALGCTTKQGVEVGRYWLGGGANAHACIQHVLHLTHFR